MRQSTDNKVNYHLLKDERLRILSDPGALHGWMLGAFLTH